MSDADEYDEFPPRGFDKLSAVMAVVTVAALAWAGWSRFGPRTAEPLAVGASPPALRLRDAADSEPLVLLGLRGKVVWITFWSARAADAGAGLSDLDRVWRRLRPRTKFAMVAAAVESDQPEPVRSAVAKAGVGVPVYLAAPETRAAYGADGARLPLTILVDPDGRVAAVSQGHDRASFDRLVDQAESFLEEIEPLGKTRFARAGNVTPSSFAP